MSGEGLTEYKPLVPGPVLDLGHCHVENWRQYENEEVWSGTVYFFGSPHHFTAIRVAYNEEHSQWFGTNDPEDRLAGYYALYDYPPVPAKIPGLYGEFVILVHPHGD